jgi:polysaccharide export outer membrane protein
MKMDQTVFEATKRASRVKASWGRIALSAGLLVVFCAVVGLDSGKAVESQDVQIARLLEPADQKAKPQPPPPSPKQSDEGYLIGPSDVLSISVWRDTELTRAVTQKLKEFISDPQVTVIVQEVKSRTFSILGKIAKPGSYPLGKPTTVLEAIAIAGGFLDFAKQNKIYVIRAGSVGTNQTYPFDYKKVIKGQHPEENITLQNGDTIVVP